MLLTYLNCVVVFDCFPKKYYLNRAVFYYPFLFHTKNSKDNQDQDIQPKGACALEDTEDETSYFLLSNCSNR